MALSGSVSTGSYSGRYYTLSWWAAQSISGNYSDIHWTLIANGMSGGWIAERTLYVDIYGERVYSKTDRVERYDGNIATGTKRIGHDTAGARSFSISLGAAVYGSSVNVTGSNSFTLDTIPRKATITSAPDFTDEANPILKYSNPAGNSVDKLQACISMSGAVDDIAYRDISKTGTSYTFNLTDAERKVLWAEVDKGSSATVHFFVKTVIGDTTYLDSLAKTVTLVNHEPIASGTITTDDYTQELTGNSTTIISGYTDIEFAATATARKGATISSVYCYNNGTRYTGTTGTISNVTNGSFSFYATDSRGNTTDYTEQISLDVIPYIPLTANVEAEATLAEDNAVTIDFTISGNCYTGFFGAGVNEVEIEYELYENKEDGTQEQLYFYTVYPTMNSDNTYSYSNTLTVDNYKNTYELYVYVYDVVDSLTDLKSKKLSVNPVFDWSGEDFNFNVPVTIQGNLLADFIIETYQEDIWYVEKWASGKAVCYGKKNYGSVATHTWGNLYETASLSIDFPIGLFIENPQVMHIDMLYGGAGGWIERGAHAPTKDGITGIAVARNSVSVTYSNLTLGFHIIGKWR